MSKKKSSGKSRPQAKSTSQPKSVIEYFKKIISSKHAGLFIACLYLLIIGIISFVFHKVGDYGIETDFFWGYVPNAKDFLAGKIPMDAFRGPLYPIVLGIIGFLVGDFFKAGILIGVLSAASVIYVTNELLKNLFSPIISFIVLIFLAINPVFIQYSYSAGTDMFFNALVAVTLFFFFRKNELSYKNIIIAAIFGGLSYLTRYNGIFLISFVFVILFVNFWKVSWVSRIKVSILFAFVFVLTLSPWGFYCLSEKGSFFYNENYKNIAYEIYGKGKIAWDEFWFKESSKITSMNEVVFKDFGLFTSTMINNIGDHFINDMEKLIGWQFGVFFILGLILIVISNPVRNWKSPGTGYYLINIFFFALLLLVFYSERFSMFLIPFYLVISVQPFINEKFKLKKFIPNKLSYVLLIGILVFTFAKSYSFNSRNINSGPDELLVLKDWYEQNVPLDKKGNIISARKAHVAYYLDMSFYLMPMADTYDEFISKLKEKKVDYLYFSQIEAAMRYQFQSLLNPNSAHPGLEVVVYFDNPPAVLYKVIHE